MVARQHSMASRGETVIGETAKGAVGGGFLGAIAGTVTGALVGAAGGLLNPIGLTMAVVGVVAAMTGIVAAPLALGIGLGVPAGIGGAIGALTGMGVGAGVGAAAFGVKGAFRGGRRADEEEQLYAEHKYAAKAAQQNSIAQTRADAAEQYAAAGYQEGFQEGANMVVNRIIAAHQMQAAQQGGFVDRCCEGKKPGALTPEGVRESKMAAAAHEHVVS